jgi:3'(2'), 5'-bisphosphate nucleotidase
MAKVEGEVKQTELIKAGSALKFCLVADGQASYYPRYAPTMEWDTAAGHAICNAVGVEVYSLETDAPLKYNKENLLNPWFIVRKIG